MRIRSINKRAAVLPCSRGRLEAKELVEFHAFDLGKVCCCNGERVLEWRRIRLPRTCIWVCRAQSLRKLQMAEEDMEDEEHFGHGYGSGHDHAHHDESHGHGHGHDASCEEDVCSHDHGHDAAAHNHDHSHAHAHHNPAVGTFSLVRDGMCVEPLKFARWVRRLANIKAEEQGTLYRCKALLAQVR